MACPFTGRVAQKVPDAYHEKAAAPAVEPPAYGLDTDNFNYDFLNPTFDPADMRKVASEGILLAAGGVAILLQMASPGVAAGVNRHSNFAYRVQDRLRTTMTFVYCMAYGTPEEKKTIINMVHGAHAPVRGDGYSADDPELQMWVAATLYATGTDVYEKIFGKFDDATADRIYAQYAVLATALRVPPAMWPKTRADFWAYWDKTIASLPITKDALDVKRDLLYNKNMPLWVRLNMPAVRLATAEWMPEQLREPYGWKKHSRSRRLGYWLLNLVVQGTYPHLPKSVRTYPVTYYMKDMRRRMAANDHIIGKKGEEV